MTGGPPDPYSCYYYQPGVEDLDGVMSPSRPEPLALPEAAMLLSLLIEPEAAMPLVSPVAGAAAIDESVVAGAVAAASAPEAAAAEESVAVFFLQAETAKAAAAIMPAVARRRVLLIMEGPLVMKGGATPLATP